MAPLLQFGRPKRTQSNVPSDRPAEARASHRTANDLGKCYLVTEFVDGADLRQVIQAGGALPPEGVAVVGARVADALEFIHAHALFHRDVKPANVMISREGDVKVMDFGIARDPLAAQLTSTGVVVGTPAYVAPEVLCGDEADERSEVWSLGARSSRSIPPGPSTSWRPPAARRHPAER